MPRNSWTAVKLLIVFNKFGKNSIKVGEFQLILKKIEKFARFQWVFSEFVEI